MPKRTNLFQQVIAVIHAHMAEGSEIEESAMLLDSESGVAREVDLTITSKVAGHEVVVALEATAKGRRADQPWVDSMLGKHKSLPTDKLVLVSESGFTKPARIKAEANRAVALEPRNMTADDPAGEVVNQLRSLWPKRIYLGIEKVRFLVSRPNQSQAVVDVTTDLLLYDEDGNEWDPLYDVTKGLLEAQMERIVGELGVVDIDVDTEDGFFIEVPKWEAEIHERGTEPRMVHACLRWTHSDPPELHRIENGTFFGIAKIYVAEIELTHKTLGEVAVSYGEGKLGGSDALVVVTEGRDASKGTVRFKGDATPPEVDDTSSSDGTDRIFRGVGDFRPRPSPR